MSKKKCSHIIFLCLTVLIWVSCSKDEPGTGSGEDDMQIMRSLKVTVKHLYDKHSGTDSLLPKASVLLYETKHERETGYGEVFQRMTDSTGVVEFSHLEETYYYVEAQHPKYGSVKDEIKTPGGTRSFLEMVIQ